MKRKASMAASQDLDYNSYHVTPVPSSLAILIAGLGLSLKVGSSFTTAESRDRKRNEPSQHLYGRFYSSRS